MTFELVGCAVSSEYSAMLNSTPRCRFIAKIEIVVSKGKRSSIEIKDNNDGKWSREEVAKKVGENLGLTFDIRNFHLKDEFPGEKSYPEVTSCIIVTNRSNVNGEMLEEMCFEGISSQGANEFEAFVRLLIKTANAFFENIAKRGETSARTIAA